MRYFYTGKKRRMDSSPSAPPRRSTDIPSDDEDSLKVLYDLLEGIK